jgi:hypothetical protein
MAGATLNVEVNWREKMRYVMTILMIVALALQPTTSVALQYTVPSTGAHVPITLAPGTYQISAVSGGWNAWGGVVALPDAGWLCDVTVVVNGINVSGVGSGAIYTATPEEAIASCSTNSFEVCPLDTIFMASLDPSPEDNIGDTTVDVSQISSDIPASCPIESGLFTQNRVRQCSTDTSCIGGDPTIEVKSDHDLSNTGMVSTRVVVEDLDAQAATSAGYLGEAFTPAMSAYAYTSGPQRYTVASFGFQRYEFIEAGEVTLTGTITYSHSGRGGSSESNGRVRGSFMAFQLIGDVFVPENCNIFVDYEAVNIAGVMNSCVTGRGFSGVEFPDVISVEEAFFNTSNDPVSDGWESAELIVTGSAGDVFFLGAYISIQAHLGGFGDTANTLVIDIDEPDLVQPSFTEETFLPAPTRLVNVDIKPGGEPNCININGHGKIPVAVLGSNAFDVADIDPASLRFGGLEVGVRANKGPHCNIEYANEDGYLDLMCHFRDDPSNWSPSDIGTASVFGLLYDGREVTGTDTICLVP